LIKKKIVFAGPPDVGKTTIKEAFFEHASPISLLENPLEPSRGINSSIYSAFNSDLGLFDLAGQENNIWFSNKGKKVFNESNIIICVFDIRNSLESIIQFLLSIYKLKKELHLHSCKIIAFLHKIDLRSNSYVNQKLKIIQDFITIQHPQGKDFKIFKTSITIDYFYKTYYIISEILNVIYERNLISVNHKEFQKLKKELSILLNSDVNLKYNITDLVHKFKFNSEDLKKHMERLENLGFIEIFDEYQFKLTDSAYYFKVGLEKEFATTDESHFNKNIEVFHIFLFFKEKKA